jgi:Ca2+-transporting ATPase
MVHPSQCEISDVLARFNTTVASGLSATGVEQSRQKYGSNTLPQKRFFSFFRTIARELLNPLSLVLIGASVIAFLLHDVVDAVVMLIALAVTTVISLWQEGGVAHVFEALEKESVQEALVIRDGAEVRVASTAVVVGDILKLVGGSRIAADARLIEVHGLFTNEAALTGEWTTQEKKVARLHREVKTQDMTNMVWAGTYVAEGYGSAVVVAVGPHTVFGSLALSATEQVERPTPFQEKLQRFSRELLLIVAIVVALVFTVGLLRGVTVAHMFFVALAVGVSAMPEGLPAIMTVVLAEAMRRILQRGGLVKRLVSAETCGSVTTIITDKTGTLTTGEMMFSGVVTPRGVEPAKTLSPLSVEVLASAVRASDAFIEQHGDNVSFNGRALEAAIVAGGYAHKVDVRELDAHGHGRITMVQFEPTRRFAISLNNHPTDGARIYLTGSPEHILALCTKVLDQKGPTTLTEEHKKAYTKALEHAAGEGKRFTAVAYRVSSDKHIHEDIIDPSHGEQLGFTFGGILLFEDAIRTDVARSLERARAIGVKVIMATGDHPETARYVAERVGLYTGTSMSVITGAELDGMTDDDLVDALAHTPVFARMLPQHKMRLAHVLQEEGEVVAMTGDGINDAPALVAADIGVTLATGTDIAKEASDLVLTNNSFAVIIDAIMEGRRALRNIRTVVMYILTVSLSTTVLVVGALMFSTSLPLLPVQILWVNIVVEGFMCFPFAYNALKKDVLTEHLEGRTAAFFPRRVYASILGTSLCTGLFLLGLYAYVLDNGVPSDSARTLIFLALCFGSIISSLSFIDIDASLWHSFKVHNKTLYASLFLSLAIVTAGCIAPFSFLLSTTNVTLAHGVWALLTVPVFLACTELSKFVFLRPVHGTLWVSWIRSRLS